MSEWLHGNTYCPDSWWQAAQPVSGYLFQHPHVLCQPARGGGKPVPITAVTLSVRSHGLLFALASLHPMLITCSLLIYRITRQTCTSTVCFRIKNVTHFEILMSLPHWDHHWKKCPITLLWRNLTFILHLLTSVNIHSVKALQFKTAILILIQHMSAEAGSLPSSSICLSYPSVNKSNLLCRPFIPIWS